MLLYGHDEALARWAAQRLGIKPFEKEAIAIGVAHNSKLAAVAVYHQYREPNIEVTFVTASPRWASKGAIKAILRYPFLDLKVRRVTAITEAKNQPARAFLCRLGFKEEGYHPQALPNGDAVTYGLLAADARRWTHAEEENGKVRAFRAQAR